LETDTHRVMNGHTNAIRALQANDKILISAGADKLLYVWDIEQGNSEGILKVKKKKNWIQN